MTILVRHKRLRGRAEYFVSHADVATGVKPVHHATLLIMMWHTFERGIYTCFTRKQQLSVADQLLSVNLPAPATASTLAVCVLNWYTNQIWETVKSKEEQNKTANAKAAVNIMLNLVHSLERAANERLHAFDGKKFAAKAFSLHKYWRRLRSTHPAAYQALEYLMVKSNASTIDAYTPESHQWGADDLA
ncbi:Hypothetical protein PHPALM_18407 [Phytophthora palmivora]|uniref:Uncharacterized protein n=1 Tax=Phytophthora palmivora TaxID=4796 RepID=A0A2P4XJS9_9STRA|nr:Hypothetical protein PHPALM_18407 [Phytophthora palmivora]